MTILLTVFAGVAVFVLGQILQRLFIEPIQEQRKVMARVVHTLARYRHVHSIKGGFEEYDYLRREGKPLPFAIELWTQEMKELRAGVFDLAADLRASKAAIPLYGALARVRIGSWGPFVPAKAIEEASDVLLEWGSRPADCGESRAYRDRLETVLNVAAVVAPNERSPKLSQNRSADSPTG